MPPKLLCLLHENFALLELQFIETLRSYSCLKLGNGWKRLGSEVLYYGLLDTKKKSPSWLCDVPETIQTKTWFRLSYESRSSGSIFQDASS